MLNQNHLKRFHIYTEQTQAGHHINQQLFNVTTPTVKRSVVNSVALHVFN